MNTTIVLVTWVLVNGQMVTSRQDQPSAAVCEQRRAEIMKMDGNAVLKPVHAQCKERKAKKEKAA